MSNIITFLITKKTTVTNLLHVRVLASKKMDKFDIYIWNNLIPTNNTIAVYLQHNTKTSGTNCVLYYLYSLQYYM